MTTALDRRIRGHLELSARRVQRRRERGWRMPEGAVYVGRPTRWGNPFLRGPVALSPYSREEAVALYRIWAAERAHGAFVAGWDWLAPLRGRRLACWCPLELACHVDVLLEMLGEEGA